MSHQQTAEWMTLAFKMEGALPLLTTQQAVRFLGAFRNSLTRQVAEEGIFQKWRKVQSPMISFIQWLACCVQVRGGRWLGQTLCLYLLTLTPSNVLLFLDCLISLLHPRLVFILLDVESPRRHTSGPVCEGISRAGKLTLNMGSTIPWAGVLDSIKMEKVNQVPASISLLPASRIHCEQSSQALVAMTVLPWWTLQLWAKINSSSTELFFFCQTFSDSNREVITTSPVS